MFDKEKASAAATTEAGCENASQTDILSIAQSDEKIKCTDSEKICGLIYDERNGRCVKCCAYCDKRDCDARCKNSPALCGQQKERKVRCPKE